jgi:glutamyl-tRNA synthetase
LVQLFDPTEIHSANARFDLHKCQWFNAQFLRAMTPEALLAAARPFMEARGLVITDESVAAAAVFSVKEKVSLLTEIPAWVHYFFREDYPFESDVSDKLKSKPENPGLLRAVATVLAGLKEWTEVTVHAAIEEAARQAAVKPGALMPLLRAALTGQSRGPGVSTIVHLVGQQSTLRRIDRALSEVC